MDGGMFLKMIAGRANVLSVLQKYDIFIFLRQNQYVFVTFCTFFSVINFPAQAIERKPEHWCLKLQAVMANSGINIMPPASHSILNSVQKRAPRETQKLS